MRILLTLLFCLGVIDGAIPTSDTVTNSIGMKFKRIPAGTFLMGNADSLPSFVWPKGLYCKTGLYNEKPVHKVNITQDFYIGVCEVTNKQFRAFQSTYGSDIPWYAGGDNLPVNKVTWFAADSFCKWLTAHDPGNWTYRLPTEAEWEYCCRAGTTTPWFTGDTVKATDGSMCFGWGCTQTLLPVGSFPANPYGLFDMMGNAAEWCLDWYGPYTADSITDPAGHIFRQFGYSATGMRSVRGAGIGYALAVRSSTRAGMFPDFRQDYLGFRVVISNITPSHLVASVDTPLAWQKNVSPAAPVPRTNVNGEDYTDAGDRSFKRVRMVQNRAQNLVFTEVYDTVVYVSVSAIRDAAVKDRKSAGLFACSLSVKNGVLYRISNKYELACAGIRANAADYFLTILPELEYTRGRPHPDVAYYIKRHLKAIPEPTNGPLYSYWNVNLVSSGVAGAGIVECPNRDLLTTFYTDIGEDTWLSNSAITRLRYGADEWDAPACDFDLPGYQNGFSYYYRDTRGRLVGGPTSWSFVNNMILTAYLFGNRWVSSDNGVHWSSDITPQPLAINPAWQWYGDTLVWQTWNGNLAYSLDYGQTWKQFTTPGDHGIEASCSFLDDGSALVLSRGGVVGGTYLGKFTSKNIGRTWAKDSLPFNPYSVPGNHLYHIKLQSGRILLASGKKSSGKEWIFGESADQGNTWFCRRLCEASGYAVMTQTRDGLIHLIGDEGNRPGGAFTHLTFSEQWLREGTFLPDTAWTAKNPPARTLASASQTEPFYFDTLPTTGVEDKMLSATCKGVSITATPNPFNPSVRLAVSTGLPNPSLIIFDCRGVKVANLSQGLSQGGSVLWDAKGLASGIYMAVLNSAGKTVTHTLFLIR